MSEETIDSLKKALQRANDEIIELKGKLKSFEGPGKAKMYYSMNRQMSDLADMMNARDLKKVNLDDAADKTMERMKIIWGSVKTISEILPLLRQSGGITDNEADDLGTPFIETVAETRR